MGIDKKYRVPKIITSDGGGLAWLRVLLLLSLVFAVGWYAYQLGGSDLSVGIVGFKPPSEKRLKVLMEERDDLRRQLKIVQQSAQVDQEAMRSIKEQIKRFQDERLAMEEELAFLRGIVSGSSNKTGLRVQKFKLEPGITQDQFSYKFSVSQVIKSGSVAKGRIYIRLEGLRDGKTEVLDLKQLTADKLQSHKMRFRYFQDVEGKLKLPTDFSPVKLTIEIKPDNKKLDSVTATYDWPL